MATASSTIWLVIYASFYSQILFLIVLFTLLAHPQLPYHMMYQPAQQVHMRQQFLPQHQSQQPQQLIGGDGLVSENNLTTSSTVLRQPSVAVNSVQYDSYSQQRSQVVKYLNYTF